MSDMYSINARIFTIISIYIFREMPNRQIHTPNQVGVSAHSAASIVEYPLSPNFVRAVREVFERLNVDGVIEQGDFSEFTLSVV